MPRITICIALLACCCPSTAQAQPCKDADGDGYGVYPGTSTLAGCTYDGIDCNDASPAVHPFAKEICGNKIDDNCRHGVDEGCGAPAAFDGWRVMPVRSKGEFSRKELGGRAEQWLQGAARCRADPKVIYLSHDCSPIWRSRDGGKTWHKPLSHGLSLPHGQSIEVDPLDCDRVMIVIDNASNYKNPGFTGIYLSEDGGEHWTPVQQGPTLHSRRYEHNIAFAESSADAKGALTWYTALYNKAAEPGHDQAGLYRSDDRGRSWKRLASLTQHELVYEVQVSPADAKLVLVATGKGLLRSTDGGATLKPLGDLPAGEVTSVAFSPKAPQTIYAVARAASAGASGLYRSTNGGASFKAVKSGNSLHQAVLSDARRLFVHPTDGSVFYVLPQTKTGGQTAIRTNDGGATFSTTSISLPADIKAWRWGINISGSFAFVLISAKDSKDVVAQGGGAALYRTTDGKVFGNGSTLYTGANCGGQNYSIAFDPSDPERFALGHQDIGMYLTENGGDWFVSRGVPHDWVSQGKLAWTSQWTLDMHPTQTDRIVGVSGTSFNRKVLRTLDAGLSWSITDSASGHWTRVVHHPYDPKLVLAGAKYSTDGGGSYTPLPIPAALADSGLQVMDLCRAQPDVVYTASRTSKRILRSTDRGKTWSLYVQPTWSIAPYDSYITFAVDPLRCGVIYTLDAQGDLARYDGTSWKSLGVLKQLSVPKGYFTFVRAVMVDPNHPEVIYASTFGAGIPSIFRSTDSGASWKDVSYNRFRAGVGGFNISPHSGEVFVGSCSGTWVLPPPYPTKSGVYHKLVPRPSCYDGLKNGQEGGIDCGGDCAASCQRDGLPVTDGPHLEAGPAGDGGGDGPQHDGAADAGEPRRPGDDGCSCNLQGGEARPVLAGLLLFVALAWLFRRKIRR